ncbi:MAG: ROK family transcriptional regulator [Ancalomicrobiaceae bacterium]|nr:ROK family transcriptional regulator [Ancalomicrobiaceae bacterium]
MTTYWQFQGSAPPQLTDSARAVLKAIVSAGPATRPQLSASLLFSKPTISVAVNELEGLGLVAPVGVSRGLLGRTPVTYGVGPNAGFIIGIDCGTTRVKAIASRIDGTPAGKVEQSLGDQVGSDRYAVIEQVVASLLAGPKPETGPLRGIAIALPNIISPSLDRLPDRDDFIPVLERLKSRYLVPILLENNVNCAALAEYHEGAAKDHSFSVYIQIGVKVGVGIVLEGRLFRGFRGGAGEIGHLPFPWSETEQPQWQRGETYLGAAALVERTRQAWPADEAPAPATTAELFDRFERSATARAMVQRHARDIGNLAAACVSILDPQLIVLGGGVGQNAVLLPGVEQVVRTLCWPVEIVVSQLSNQATVLGAVRLAIDFAMARLLGEDGKAAFLYPGALTADLISVSP